MIKMLLISEISLATNLERSGLRQLGIHVVVVQEAETALSLLRQNRVDIVMINIDYFSTDKTILLSQQIRSSKALNKLPVIASSAHIVRQVHDELQKAGVDLVIQRPLPKDALITAIKTLLHQDSRRDERNNELPYVKAALNNGIRTYPLAVINISISGMLGELTEELHLGKECHIALTLKDVTRPLIIVGKTLRAAEGPINTHNSKTHRVAIKFVSFEGGSKDTLEKYLEKYAEEKNTLTYYL